MLGRSMYCSTCSALSDLGRRDLDAFELQQHAQFAPQRLHVRFGQGIALVQAGEDHLQALLDAAAQHLRRFLRGEEVHHHGQQIGHLSDPYVRRLGVACRRRRSQPLPEDATTNLGDSRTLP